MTAPDAVATYSYSPLASDILQLGLATLEQRGRDRDQPDGERTMPRAVQIFQLLTGKPLSEEDGWLLMVIIKLVRAQSGASDIDHYVDGANYVALAGEARLRRPAVQANPWIHERPCTSCDGRGLLPLDDQLGSEICATCDGAGVTRTIDCPTCERTGLLPGSGGSSAVACPTCNGKGELPR